MKQTGVPRENKWVIDPLHSEISFKVRHLMISHVRGTFKTFDASIYTTGVNFTTTSVDLWIDASSITTGDLNRDAHLTGADFLDTEKHKQITFTSDTMGAPDKKGNCELWGDLTMQGITKKVMLDVQIGGVVKDPWGNERAGFTISGKINRSDWGLTWNTAMETGGIMVGDEINITCEMELINEHGRKATMVLESETATRKV